MKITNDIRRQIIANAIASTDIPKRREKLKADLKVFAKKVATNGPSRPTPQCILDIWADAATRRQVAGYVYTTASVEVSGLSEFFNNKNAFRSENDSYFDADRLPCYLKFDDPIPAVHGNVSVNIAGTPFEAEGKALVAYHRATNTQEEELKVGIRAIVYGANTQAQLLKVWPEGEKFLPPSVAPVRSTALLPAETILAVNKRLGLSK